MTILAISGLFHDLNKKRSFVTIRWEDDSEKRLSLVVPFGCKLDGLEAAAQKALKSLAAEIETATLRTD